jgi:arylsulfatase A-like enzyme
VRPTLLWLVPAGALATVGIDLARIADPVAGYRLSELVVLTVLGLVGSAAFMVPGVLVGWWRGRAPGLVLASVVVLNLAVWWRFGPMVNVRATSLGNLGGWLAIAVGAGGLGWVGSAFVERTVRRWAGVLAVVGVLGLVGGFTRSIAAAPIAVGDGPNVVLVTLDTTRRDRLPMYGPTAVAAPALAELAASGVVFEDAVSTSPLTGPSHRAMLSGVLPMTSGVVANATSVGPAALWLPERMAEEGWVTAGFVAGFPLDARFGFQRGFALFDDDFSVIPGLHELTAVRAFDALVRGNLPRERRGDRVNRRALDWVASAPEPFFLWAHYYDPHAPYEAPGSIAVNGPGPTDGARLDLPFWWDSPHADVTDVDWLERQYDAEVAYVDGLVGELLGEVRAASSRDVVVVVVADHGESLTEHGIVFDHGTDLYDPALRVPWLVAGPGVVGGHRVACQVSTVDVAPTILELIGLDATAADGVGRADWLRGGPCASADAFATTVAGFGFNPPIDHALRRPPGKVVMHQVGPDEFFDLGADPLELAPLPIEAGAAEAAILAERVSSATQIRSAEHDAATRELLRELGYLEP